MDALVLDLRASPPTNDFATAAEFAKRFCAKGKILFSLRKPAAKEERTFTSDQGRSYEGLLMVLTDGSTAGPAEALAGVLRLYDKAMIIGEPTAGRAVEYSDLHLPSGKVLRVAVSEAVLPQMEPLYPSGIKPDLVVEMPEAEKRQIFQQSLSKGMSRYVFETERPHFNEAALLAGRNPEIDVAEAIREGRAPTQETKRDPVLQQAIDLVTSVEVFKGDDHARAKCALGSPVPTNDFTSAISVALMLRFAFKSVRKHVRVTLSPDSVSARHDLRGRASAH